VKSFARKIAGPGRTRCFQQMQGADDVSVDEISRPGDGAVHVRFRRQMQNVRYRILAENCRHSSLVAEIRLFKQILGMVLNVTQVGGVAGVSQAIQVDQQLDFGLVNDLVDHI
jgi:hypothetical protein